MRTTPLLLAIVLSFGATASVVAAGAPAAGASNSGTAYGCSNGTHSTGHRGNHDSSSPNGDALNVPHSGESSSTATGSGHASGSSGAEDDSPVHFGAGSVESSPDGSDAHGASGLSWQSLLPGSIQ